MTQNSNASFGRLSRGSASALPFIAFGVVWALYFIISEAPGAIHQDMTEAYVWGQEFQLGYHQHPPFWAWICGVWFLIFPRSDWAFYSLSALNATLGLWGAWVLIGRFARGPKRVAATMLLITTPFFTFFAYKYNANSIFLSLWPWTMVFFVKAIDKGRLRDAIWFGVFVACALLSKYFALILCATCLIAALQHPARRRYFSSASPWVSVSVALGLWAPHLYWLLVSGAPPLRYLNSISGLGILAALNNAQATLFGALGDSALMLALVIFVAKPRPAFLWASIREKLGDPRFRVMMILALAPLALSLGACLALRSKLATPMLMGTFSLVPLLAIEIAAPRDLERLARLATRTAIILSLGALAAAPALALGKFFIVKNSRDTEPRKELAEAATRLWTLQTQRPLSFVGGSTIYADAVVFYSPQRAHSFADFDQLARPWVTPEALGAHGLLAVCETGDTQCRAAAKTFLTPTATQTEMILTHQFLGYKAEPISFLVTIVPPRE